MAQFCVHRNKAPGAKAGKPYLLDLQHHLLAHMETRVVAPLAPVANAKEAVEKLTPEVVIDGVRYHIRMYEIGVVPRGFLGAVVPSADAARTEILSAFDVIISGI